MKLTADDTMITKEQLTKIGGKEWKTRMYFNNTFELFGFKFDTYKSGNISHATKDGRLMSNSAANSLKFVLTHGKVWFDLSTQTWHHRFDHSTDYYGEEIGKEIVAKLQAKLEEETP